MLRSILSIVVGYIVMAALVVVADFALAAVFPEYREAGEQEIAPPALPVAVNLGCGLVAAAAGGFAAARIARRARFGHALVLAGLLLAFGAVYALAGWNGVQPNWYLALLPLAGAIGATAGGSLGAKSGAAP